MKKSKLAKLGMMLVLVAALLGIAPMAQAQPDQAQLDQTPPCQTQPYDDGLAPYEMIQPMSIPIYPERCVGMCSC